MTGKPQYQVRILLIDPCKLLFGGISACLDGRKYIVVNQIYTLEIFLQQSYLFQFNLVVIGPFLKEAAKFMVCKEITNRSPDARIIMFSEEASDVLFQIDAAHSGVSACLTTDITCEEFASVIGSVMQGHLLFPREILFQAFQPLQLTKRENEILKLLVEKKTDREIAKSLCLQTNTVRNHSQHILEKLGVHNREEAVRRALRGWL